MSEFDRKLFAELIEMAIGEKRSMNSFANQSGVNVAHVSRLRRAVLDSAPSPAIIRRFSDNAINGITYEQLMRAAGHLVEGEAGSSVPDLGVREMMMAKEQLTPELYVRFVEFTRGARKSFVEQMKTEEVHSNE